MTDEIKRHREKPKHALHAKCVTNSKKKFLFKLEYIVYHVYFYPFYNSLTNAIS